MTLEVKGLPELLRHVHEVSSKAKTLDQKTVAGIAVTAKTIVLNVAGQDIPGRRLSRFGNGKGVRLSASFKIKTGAVPSALLLPTPPGPWYLLNHGGKAHDIGNRSKRRGGPRGQAGFLGSTARGFAAVGPVHHPAFTAKHTWDHAAGLAVTTGSKTFARVSKQAYVKLFVG